jgi:hypothetical protein
VRRVATMTKRSDHFFGSVFHLFPFWCLGAKRGEDYLSIYVVHHFYLDLACKTLI